MPEGKGLNTKLNLGLVNPRLYSKGPSKNPYLNDIKPDKKRAKLGNFHSKGDISGPLALKRRQEEETRLKIKNGDLPDPILHEDKWISLKEIPDVEWWDRRYYLPEAKGSEIEEDVKETEDEDEDEDAEENFRPDIGLIFHPVPPKIQSVDVEARLYLTTKERHKLRRNKRLLKQKDQEKEIKLGLRAKPVNKMKLSTIMHHQIDSNSTYNGISDPTKWEEQVKSEMTERKLKHEETNRRRHEQAIEKRKLKDSQTSLSNDGGSGSYFVNVYRFNQLINPSIRYKLTTNARQLQLRGLCIREKDEGPGIIILLGEKEKSMRFMNRLILNRLPWKEPFTLKDQVQQINMSNNHIELSWTGQVSDKEFKQYPNRWFMKVCQDKESLLSTLAQFEAEHYYNV